MTKKKNKIANNIKNSINKALSETTKIDPAPQTTLTLVLTKLLKKGGEKKKS